jgi:hypothetical protein
MSCHNVAVPANTSSTDTPNIVGILDELAAQGLSVKTHNAHNSTWFIKGEGIFLGYIATTDELIELKEANRLDLNGIKSLG